MRLDVSAERGADGGQFLRFAVSDTGPGIPEEMRADIFEPFRQAGAERLRPREGTGLGLSISRGLARLMGGDVVLAPATGRGACFVTTIPLRAISCRPWLMMVVAMRRSASPRAPLLITVPLSTMTHLQRPAATVA